ncbi:DNA/RNA nuclease SfsA [Desertifilum sp. FACHB-1129]|uniref:Sugar fermentation stimulation protein homolog n=1 Tax=Desertifilum tharense IPPAS B-1220 TaxID=1781255 RepID=A0A1E5QPP5_9CYAN|nr:MULTISPECIES: DNA/RNA nuclease SfsA [Desertifilum]MDA0209866.1 DNA/RNA nuclease SfsA [Cyanobacteria bacterium FC1]MBD2310644.1 DNA/RNA nuclease SfsA [Desertifilum sp. FACHB-1129]MBD2320681.1 DNA/RNA nuclease SfsA [Desertifilum sp. FACHB-866]MBD2330809.1 DNA/RNA nuclease SfsA [Desertifilum sp. FACHB-868]OEJ76642.1 sugar fermentation stimulation protein SfsA [Desertifilum tharense IPPAS B-1220]
MSLIYEYPQLHPGILVKRYKRFFADIELATGEVVTAHCPNTGPMTGICQIGNPVYVSYNNDPKRKLRYTWEMIQVTDNEPTWVGVNTALPNRLIKIALQKQLFPELGDYQDIRPEVAYGSSRVDFLLTGEKTRPIYLEVKNTTWVKGRLALFPDTVTTRGQKHLRELAALLPEARAVMLYLINRADCTEFAPGTSADPVYGKLFNEAIALGLEVLPCRFAVSPQGIRYLGLASLRGSE